MHNNLLFLLSTFSILGFSMLSLRFGKTLLIAWIALLGVLANLFVLKQIQLFGLNATASDVFAIGSLLGLNLLREYYDLKSCKQAIWASFACMIFFTFMAQVHLAYTPSEFDSSHGAYQTLLSPNPRIMLASITVFFTVQYFDLYFYNFILKRFVSTMMSRNALSLVLSQALDTVLFTFLGLYGLIDNPGEIILFSYTIKLLAIACMVPFTSLSKRWLPT